MKNRNRRLTALLIVLLLLGAVLFNRRQLHALISPPPADTLLLRGDNPLNYRLADSAIGLLHSGDIVLRTGADMTSYMLRQMNRRDRRFSHCGILMIENDSPFVYHSIGGEDNPDARLRREPAARFFSPLNNERLGIARLNLSTAQAGRLRALVQEYYAARPRFDMDFDLRTDEQLYCAEFVYKAVRRAAADTAYFPLSEMPGRRFIGVDDLFINAHARLVCDIPYR